MDKYEVDVLLGEGSFGRVYRARRNSDSVFVAIKVISKRGRSLKELKGLRRECEILKHLHHPNIIQMLESFETDNEIVVITDYSYQALNSILSKEGYLPEGRVQPIVWDLVSALYYLHSHRVLHRDLKPQNILLDADSTAKLCDFGFARNMSTGTHVLTSIKGTPLYMAPELIEEQPYDHNADLWSLGCIIYELLVGAPPFCTPSILHLIRLIKHEAIQWPTYISKDCTSFLKGLLQKNPLKRITWPEILKHPFIMGHVNILKNTPVMPFTRPMSANSIQVKEMQVREKQRLIHINKKHIYESSRPQATVEEATETNKSAEKSLALDELNENLSKLSVNPTTTTTSTGKTPELTKADPLEFHEDNQPIENEEWIVFIQKTIEEVMGGEFGCLLQSNGANILVNPLRNINTSPKVVELVANLFSLPFVVPGITETMKEQILKVYLEVKLVPNLIYAVKLLFRRKVELEVAGAEGNTDAAADIQWHKLAQELEDDDLDGSESVSILICHLVHLEDQFLSQFCDSIAILRIWPLIRYLLRLAKKRARIVVDLLGILTHVLRQNPENCVVVDLILNDWDTLHKCDDVANNKINILGLLRSNEALLRERTCHLLYYLAKRSPETVQILWNQKIQGTLEVLVYDSIENVRNSAEMALEMLRTLDFYQEFDFSSDGLSDAEEESPKQ